MFPSNAERKEGSISKRSIGDVKLIQITIARCYGRNISNYGKKLKKNLDYGIPLHLFSTLPTGVTEISSIAARCGLMLGELCETNNLVFAWKRSDRVNKDAPQTCYLSPLRYRRMHYQNRQL